MKDYITGQCAYCGSFRTVKTRDSHGRIMCATFSMCPARTKGDNDVSSFGLRSRQSNPDASAQAAA